MDLLNLAIRIFAKDEASDTIEDVSQNSIGGLVSAATNAAKALAGLWAVKKVGEFGKAAFDAYANFEQLQGGVAKLYGNAGMSLEQYADSVGKTVDEVSKDYKRNERAQKLMMDNAQKAWRTAGMDANTYMENATSMSAALIDSLAGDTEKAAEQTDVAMQAISDNVNTFGSDMGSVTQAFMGFSKQNYSMLDNLKLGYGGSREEMERLIKDANEWGKANGEASDLSIDSFSDVVTAIEQIQKKQGIAGTTTKEAMTTIEGSMTAAKSAWQNLVTEFGKPDADVAARVGDLFDAVFGVVDDKSKKREGGLFKNVTSEVATIATNMVDAAGQALDAGVGYIRDNAPNLIANAMRSVGDALERGWDKLLDFRSTFNLVDAVFGDGGAMDTAAKVGEWFKGIGQTISDNWPYIQEQLGYLWEEIVATAQTYGPQVAEVAGRLLTMAGNAIREHAPELLSRAGELIGKLLAHIGTFVSQMVSKGRELVMGIITGTSQEGKNLRKWFSDFFPDGLLKGLGDFATFLLDAGKALIQGLIDGISEVAPDVGAEIQKAFDTVIDWFGKVGDFLSDPIGSIKDGLKDLRSGMDATTQNIDSNTGKAEQSIDQLNRTKIRDKRATATVKGNAIDGKAKKAVGDTDNAIGKLKDKTVNVTVGQKGLSKDAIDRIRGAIDRLKDKNITVTTHQNTVKKTTVEKAPRARGGIRRHARGDILIANNYGDGVDVNAVKDVMGERGPEAIVPLTSHYGKDFAEMMGEAAAKVMGGGGPTVNIYLTYNEGESAVKLVSDIADGLQLVLGGK